MEFAVLTGRNAGNGLAVGSPAAAFDIIADLRECELKTTVTKYSISVGNGLHIDEPPYSYLNHSCEPNIFIDTTSMQVRAIRPLIGGEEVVFFYPSTEWEMVTPFACGCQSPRCIRLVAGAAFVPDMLLAQYELNAHIRERLRSGVRPAFSASPASV
ncbi:SET domain-containing protein-lysine N-methyltransferase [Saccharothrix sp. AJ9571]|nr:SET domain-containing protein-lysine N-methyltransferase [Saccharothrix sp. AJ9571]